MHITGKRTSLHRSRGTARDGYLSDQDKNNDVLCVWRLAPIHITGTRASHHGSGGKDWATYLCDQDKKTEALEYFMNNDRYVERTAEPASRVD